MCTGGAPGVSMPWPGPLTGTQPEWMAWHGGLTGPWHVVTVTQLSASSQPMMLCSCVLCRCRGRTLDSDLNYSSHFEAQAAEAAPGRLRQRQPCPSPSPLTVRIMRSCSWMSVASRPCSTHLPRTWTWHGIVTIQQLLVPPPWQWHYGLVKSSFGIHWRCAGPQTIHCQLEHSQVILVPHLGFVVSHVTQYCMIKAGFRSSFKNHYCSETASQVTPQGLHW